MVLDPINTCCEFLNGFKNIPEKACVNTFYNNYAFVNVGNLLTRTQAPQAENTWGMRQLVYIENCMGKSRIVKKLCK